MEAPNGVAVPRPGLTTLSDLTGEYVWKVENFSKLGVDQIRSECFEIGGYAWQLLLFPRGNSAGSSSVANGPQMSLFLAVGDDMSGITAMDANETRKANFCLSLIRQRSRAAAGEAGVEGGRDSMDVDVRAGKGGGDDDENGGDGRGFAVGRKGDLPLDADGNVARPSKHAFSEEANDWGFNQFIPLSTVMDDGEGFLVDDALLVKAEVQVGFFDLAEGHESRQKTGYVGILNQGATCYMNSLLQTMFNINVLRKAVYNLPTSEDDKPSESMPLALQSVFHMLQFTDIAVDTHDLTKSFGWDVGDAFQQHDAQEFNRILCDRLDEVMKGTKVEGTINKLFQGHFQNYIECINIDFKSVRKEEFLDLQLVVKDCKNIYESFDEYCAEEVLDGDNQYEAEGHGKQDAKKGGKFESLPPVLNIHLRRFEFDFYKMSMVKLNDLHEFYGEIDLDVRDESGNLKYFSSTADKTVSNKYRLLSVLVHSGSVHGGHYYAYIRPDGTNWLKFDDETVTNATEEEAIQDNWGVSSVPTRMRQANAYMLVYVRSSEWDSIMCEVTEDDIAEHIRSRLRAEEAARELEKKEAAEAHLYVRLAVATDADIKSQVDSALFMDLVDVSKLETSMKLPKKMPFGEVKRMMEDKTGIPVDQQRYWRITMNDQGAVRPQDLVDGADDVPLGSLHGIRNRQGQISSFNVYLEQIAPGTAELNRSTRSVFVKKYVADGGSREMPQLEYVKHVVIPSALPFGDMLSHFKKVCGMDEGTECVLLEELKSVPDVSMLEIDLHKSADDQEVPLRDGSIIVVQQACDPADGVAFPTVTDFFTRVKDRVQVTLKPRTPLQSSEKDKKAPKKKRGANTDPPAEVFTLEMMKSWTYDDVSRAVAEHLRLDHPLKVQFTARSVYLETPRPHPIQYSKDATLQDMCRSQIYTLFYEAINLPLPEFEKLVTLRVTLHDAKHDEVTTVTVTIPRDDTVSDLQDAIKKAVGDKVKASDVLRCMEIHHWKIWQVYDPRLQIGECHMEANSTNLRAEVVPDTQTDLDKEGRMHVQCLQVEEKENRPNQAFPFSDPFLMDISPTETVGQLKLRVQKEMEIPNEEFAEWKTVLVTSLLTMEPLDDGVVVSAKIPDMGPDVLYGRHGNRSMIGFWHENKNPRRTHAHLHRNSYGGSGATIKMKI